MRDAGADVSFEQPAVETKETIEFGKAAIRFALEAATPKFFVLSLISCDRRILSVTCQLRASLTRRITR